jgi:hypothetical protein
VQRVRRQRATVGWTGEPDPERRGDAEVGQSPHALHDRVRLEAELGHKPCFEARAARQLGFREQRHTTLTGPDVPGWLKRSRAAQPLTAPISMPRRM